MADEGISAGLGFEDPGLSFLGNGMVTTSQDINSSGLVSDNMPPSFYDSSAAWDLEGTTPEDSYDLTAAAASSDMPVYMGNTWQLPAFAQQLPVSSNTNSHSVSGIGFTSGLSSGQQLSGSNSGASIVNPESRSVTTLTPALQEKLRNIAMPNLRRYESPKSLSSPDSSKSRISSSPDGSASSQKKARKRKISDDDDDDDEQDELDKPVKKTAHNMIEKRYRNNINDKIAALRDSVPSLRIMSKSAKGEDTTVDREELHGLTPAHKLNKATVLSKATEYIRHLEKRNSRLMDENNTMQARIAAFEKLFLAGAMNGTISPMQYGQETQPSLAQSPMTTSQDQGGIAAGMITVPDDMKRIISAQMAVGQPYPVPAQPFRQSNPTLIRQQQIQQQQQTQQGGWSIMNPYFGKLMVGSLAGLMMLEAIRESETSSDEPQGRGLFALSEQILGYLPSKFEVHLLGYHFQAPLKLILMLGIFFWVFIPSLFASPRPGAKQQHSNTLQTAPSLASPIHVRRQAWLTAIQTVWVPHHNFFLEAAALMLKTLKLSLRNIIGAPAFQIVTGVSPEQEAARVKAWTIALDSQLVGGDVEICKSRLVLTLLASGTLPDTPIRLMMKALHIRLLLWDLGHNRFQLGLVNALAAKLARSRWNQARRLNQLFVSLRQSSSLSPLEQNEDELPTHLAVLLDRDCDEVLSEAVLQRAHNLAFNLNTRTDIDGPIDGMDLVVDDTAVGSPMDAVAAWWSTEALHDVLTSALDQDEEARASHMASIELAFNVAPIGSIAQARAAVARAVLINEARGANIAAAHESIQLESSTNPLATSRSVMSAETQAANIDLRLALRCAIAVAHFNRANGLPGGPEQGCRLINTILMPAAASSMTLLGFTAVKMLMERLIESKDTADTFASSLERLAGSLRLWIGGPSGSKCGLDTSVRHKVVDRCLTITKTLVGMEVDTGYGTMSEDEDEGR